MIIDEGRHRMKNHHCKLTQALNQHIDYCSLEHHSRSAVCIHCTSSQKYTCTCTFTFIISPFFSDVSLDYAFMYSTCACQKAELFHFNAVRQQIHSYLLSHPPSLIHTLTPSPPHSVSVTYRTVFLSCGLS